MTVSRGTAGNFRMDTESSIGVAAGSAVYLRPEEPGPEFSDTKTRQLVANANAGHRNPYDVSSKPQPLEIHRENALKFSQRVHRPTSDGGTPSMQTLFKAAGCAAEVTSAATTIDDAAAAANEFDIAADVTDEGQAILVERDTDVFVPVLVANDDGSTPAVITPSIALSSAPADTDTVEVMHTFSTSTATTYQVPSTQTLQFRWNSWAQYDDALGDLSLLYSGCAVGSIDAIELSYGIAPVISYNIHAGKVDIVANDIGAETFADSSPFALINDDFEFAFAVASMSGVSALVAKGIEKVTITPNISTSPIPCVGEGSFAGIQGYSSVPAPPTISFTGYFEGDSTLENEIVTQLEGSNASKYIHCIQPTRDLDTPAFGIWAPNCHLAGDDTFNLELMGDLIKFQASFVCSVGGYDSLTDIDEVESSPLYIAVSSEAS